MSSQTTSLFSVVAPSVSTGFGGGCAVTRDGRAKYWGSYPGDGSGSSPSAAVDVTTAITGTTTGVVAVTQADSHKCALTTDGSVKCWGDRFGQANLGDGVASGLVLEPTTVIGLASGVVAISGGYGPTCALTALGEVKCWGGDGSVVPGTPAERATPQTISGFDGTVTSLSVGAAHACVVTSTGAAQCWGTNGSKQLGWPAGAGSSVPGTVTGPAIGVRSISAGDRHTCVVTTAEAALCWGRNSSGEVGDNQNIIWPTVPTPVTGLQSGVASINAGASATCAVTTTGATWCWGRNFSGALGTGDLVGSFHPVPVLGLGDGSTQTVDQGYLNACAVTTGANVMCWGNNIFAPPDPSLPMFWLAL